ncbi:MAG: hypothetical protein KKH12_14010 [Gammaproteobacteria bacterium]|nr:hypothetical protein [Gammaproteobacteria bacterium]MBU1482775.1 hypothetical protein [Gammaproteobacteria bacterium]
MSEKLRIPAEGFKGLDILQGLQPDGLQELISALIRVPLSFDREKFFSAVQQEVKLIALTDLQILLRTVFSLHVTYSYSNRKLDTFLDDVIKALKENDEFGKQFSKTDWTKFRSILEKLFSIDSLLCLSKAVDIVSEHSRIFTGSRVLTDIRPVFGSNESQISALFVSHNLKLEYFENGEERELFVALDDEDIESLIETLQRSQKKAKAIKAIVTVDKLPYIDN